MFLKDLFSNYTVSAAVLRGADPYQPVNLLAESIIGQNNFFPHPLAHPPVGILATAWLAYFPLKQALLVWYIVQITCVVISAALILRISGKRFSFGWILFLALVMIGWYPFTEDLVEGNLSIILLLPLLASWLAMKKNQKLAAGILLGITIALKIILWPFGLYFLLKRDWHTVISIGATILFLNFSAGLFLGFDTVIYYYQNVSAQVAPLYQAATFNLSLWTLGWRLFWGAGSFLTGKEVEPLFNLQSAAPLASVLFPALLLAAAVFFLWRSRDTDRNFAVLVSLSLLISPITWIHYYVMSIIPLLVIGRKLYETGCPTVHSVFFAGLALLLYIPTISYGQAASAFAPGNGQPVAFWPGLIVFLHPLALVVLFFMLIINNSNQ